MRGEGRRVHEMPVNMHPLGHNGKFSRRMRRVTWTASTLLLLVVIGAVVTWRIRKENAPEEYTPGETSKDITSVLDRSTAAATIPSAQPAKRVALSRTADPLADPGRPLPRGAPEPRFTDVTKSTGLASFRHVVHNCQKIWAPAWLGGISTMMGWMTCLW